MARQLNGPVRALAAWLVAIAAAGCAESPTGGEARPAPLAARGDPVVRSVDPAYGEAGTVGQVVTIKGSYFDPGSSARWLRSDGSTSQVAVRQTQYVSASELRATIDIASGAAAAFYDVEVMASNGRKGIGIEQYEVRVTQAGTNPTLRITFSDAISDGADVGLATGVRNDIAGQWYQHQECGERVTINKNAIGTRADFILDPDIDFSSGLGCPRRFFNFLPITGPNPTPYRGGQAAGYSAMRDLEALDGPVGATWPRRLVFPLEQSVSGCSGVGYDVDPNAPGSVGVTVTLLSKDAEGRRRWLVRSDAPHTPFCSVSSKGKTPTVFYLMPPLPLELTIEEVDKGVGPWP